MNVGQLIKALERFPKDMTVRLGYDFGDHVHKIAAPEVEHVEVRDTEYSDYLNMQAVIKRDDDGDEEEVSPESEKAVVLSGEELDTI